MTKKKLIREIFKQHKEVKIGTPRYTLLEFSAWVLSQRKFHVYYNEWRKNNYSDKYKPSIVRIIENRKYHFKNIKITRNEQEVTKKNRSTESSIASYCRQAISLLHKCSTPSW